MAWGVVVGLLVDVAELALRVEDRFAAGKL